MTDASELATTAAILAEQLRMGADGKLLGLDGRRLAADLIEQQAARIADKDAIIAALHEQAERVGVAYQKDLATAADEERDRIAALLKRKLDRTSLEQIKAGFELAIEAIESNEHR